MKHFYIKVLAKKKLYLLLGITIKKIGTVLILCMPLYATAFSPDGENDHAYSDDTPMVTHSYCHVDMSSVVKLKTRSQGLSKLGCSDIVNNIDSAYTVQTGKSYVQVYSETINLHGHNVDMDGSFKKAYIWKASQGVHGGIDTIGIYCAPTICNYETSDTA